MTSYRLMDGVAGRPGVGSSGTQPPGTATTFSSSYVPGLVFEVTQGSCWFEGFWWFVCASGGLTAPQKFCLWSLADATGGGHWVGSTVVPGTTVTSGALATGWNFVPVATPVQLAIGGTYIAATGVNGNFPLSQNQFGTGNPYSTGITNGPLFAYPDNASASYGYIQSPFTTSVSDPTSALPTTQDQKDILWLDVQVTDTTPGGYAGSWRLWPNQYGSSPGNGGDAAQTFLLATEAHLTGYADLNAVWYYSPNGAASLATWCGVYNITGPSLAAAVTSPSWTLPDGVTGATAGAGWVRCAFPGGTLLAPGQYKVAYYNSAGAGGSWSPRSYGYFNGTGPGASGWTSGPLYAPPMATATSAYIYDPAGAGNTPPFSGHGTEPSQGTFATSGPQYPYLAVDYTFDGPAGAIAETFWADMEVTPASAPPAPVMYQMRMMP